MSTEISDISNFLAWINWSEGPFRGNRFIVDIHPPLKLLDFGYFQELEVDWIFHTPYLRFVCASTNYPGWTIEQSNPITMYGPPVKTAKTIGFENLSLEFITTNFAFEERKFFEAWRYCIIDPFTHNLNFHNEYSGTINITIFDEENYQIECTEFLDTYPISIGTPSLSMENGDYIKLPVTFSYTSHHLLGLINPQTKKGFVKTDFSQFKVTEFKKLVKVKEKYSSTKSQASSGGAH